MNFHTVRGLDSHGHHPFLARSVRAVRQSALIAVGAVSMLCGGQVMAQDQFYVGQLFLTAANFCPRGTAEANGALMGIAQNQALYSLLGTTFGGNGIQTFGLPDLRGRSPIGRGQGSGLSPVQLGELGGTETSTLQISNLPAHNHQIISTTTTAASTKPATHATPSEDRVPAQTMNAGGYVAASEADTTMSATTVSLASSAGSSLPINIRDPYLGMTWCIVTNGIFPTRGD